MPPLLRNLPKGIKVVGPIPGMRKMSDVFLEFLDPYWNTQEELKKVAAVGIIAWNAASLPTQQRAELIEPVLATFPGDMREALQNILDELIQRKQTKFADEKRMPLNYDFTPTADGEPHFSVLFTPTSF